MGSTNIAAAMALGETWLNVPESLKFVFAGELKPWVGGKDLILRVIGDIGVDGALYRAMEFTGPTIENLSMDGRFTMCNMAVEAGAKNGIIPPDEITRAYVEGRCRRPFASFTERPDAEYVRSLNMSLKIEPHGDFPALPENKPRCQARPDMWSRHQ